MVCTNFYPGQGYFDDGVLAPDKVVRSFDDVVRSLDDVVRSLDEVVRPFDEVVRSLDEVVRPFDEDFPAGNHRREKEVIYRNKGLICLNKEVIRRNK